MESTTQTGSFWMPPQASTTAAEVDSLFDFIMDLNYIFFAIIFAMTVYLVVKYKKSDDNPIATSDLDHNSLWEGAWAFIPLILLALIAIPVPDPQTNIPISLFFNLTLLESFFA